MSTASQARRPRARRASVLLLTVLLMVAAAANFNAGTDASSLAAPPIVAVLTI